MSEPTAHGSHGGCAHHHHHLPFGGGLLSRDEQRRAARQLSLAMLALGLLLLGLAWRWLAADQAGVSQILLGVASLLVALPVARSAWDSLRHPSLHGVTDQLIALAMLGAWASGDLLTAALLPIIIDLRPCAGGAQRDRLPGGHRRPRRADPQPCPADRGRRQPERGGQRQPASGRPGGSARRRPGSGRRAGPAGARPVSTPRRSPASRCRSRWRRGWRSTAARSTSTACCASR